ncbi:hypothetical protein GCM10009122_27700 [Fulvivirga kasyanovii]|uniref:Malectin domain-containing protein n=1 Tax=Fulvivirga kasyanovii TaxID=396812 RepID=A0ABW9RT19_9BACT|nr:malectin domain-containing carbohydrate-binding protein [Fulvivirga kasyanovii]MTI27317.1 hypothetical protein [Fulvivirga kasyanovii]
MKNYVSILSKEVPGCLVLLFVICFASSYAQDKDDLSIYYQHLKSAGIQEAGRQESMMSSYLYRINAGGWETPGTWEADTWHNPSPYVNNSEIGYSSANGNSGGWGGFFTEKSRVNASLEDMEWDFPVANGSYIVSLYFAENPYTFQTIGSRVFDVVVEGKKALDDFDILRYSGDNFAAGFFVSVNVSDGNLDIDFITEKGSSLISAIEIAPGSINDIDPFINYNAHGLVFTVREGVELRIPLKAIDFDSPADSITLAGGLPSNEVPYELYDYGGGVGELVIKPGYNDASGEFGYGLYVLAEDENGILTDCNACWAFGEVIVLDTPEDSAVYRVNAGDWLPVSSPLTPWDEDTYSKPSTYVNSAAIGFATASHTVMTNPTDAPSGVFFKSRVDNSFNDMTWEFPLPDGNYIVKLYFVESNFNLPGQRVFDVAVEGAVALSYFDILSETAKNVPLQKNITTNVTDGSLSIVFEDRVANPIIAAIEVTYNGPVVVPPVAPELDLNASNANKQLLREVSVKPNPVQDRMTVVLPEAIKGEVSIRLFDSNNQVRYQSADASSFEREEVQFYISQQIPPGVYYAEISDGVSKHYVKVLKR